MMPHKPANEVLVYVLERVVTAILKEEILERVKFEFGTPDIRVRRLGSEEPVADPEGLSTGFIVRGAEGGMHGLKIQLKEIAKGCAPKGGKAAGASAERAHEVPARIVSEDATSPLVSPGAGPGAARHGG